jgi:hypothetical protein
VTNQEDQLAGAVATLRRFYAAEHVRDERGDPTGVWYLLRDLERVLGVRLLDPDDPARWLAEEDA